MFSLEKIYQGANDIRFGAHPADPAEQSQAPARKESFAGRRKPEPAEDPQQPEAGRPQTTLQVKKVEKDEKHEKHEKREAADVNPPLPTKEPEVLTPVDEFQDVPKSKAIPIRNQKSSTFELKPLINYFAQFAMRPRLISHLPPPS